MTRNISLVTCGTTTSVHEAMALPLIVKFELLMAISYIKEPSILFLRLKSFLGRFF
jgi:hypothetical protein